VSDGTTGRCLDRVMVWMVPGSQGCDLEKTDVPLPTLIADSPNPDPRVAVLVWFVDPLCILCQLLPQLRPSCIHFSDRAIRHM